MTSSSMKAPRALIVDDHELVREWMGRIVEHFGFEVAGFAEDGEDAVQEARRCEPDFVLMDLNMPVLDGISATSRIIEERAVPILICTGVMTPGLAARAMQAGACAVLVKPCPAERLRQHLETL